MQREPLVGVPTRTGRSPDLDPSRLFIAEDGSIRLRRHTSPSAYRTYKQVFKPEPSYWTYQMVNPLQGDWYFPDGRCDGGARPVGFTRSAVMPEGSVEHVPNVHPAVSFSISVHRCAGV